ncbi:MAG: hypothetical protein QM730_27340 [Anaerolineales bacterium]
MQLDDRPDFISPEYDINTTTPSQVLIPAPLDPDKTYYWRVQAFNAVGGTLGWSPTWTFRTALLPPTLTSPTQGEHILNNRPSFNWEDVPNATGYTIQISTTNTFTTPIVGSPMLSNFTPAADLPKGVLYWRVQTKGTNGPSAWSEVRSLNSLNPPPAPALTVPAANALLTDYTPALTWTNVAVPLNTTLLKYQIQVDDDSAFGSPTVEADTGTTNSYTPPADIPANVKYYWRVRAVNTLNEEGTWSTVGTFRTALTPPVLTTPDDNSDAEESASLLPLGGCARRYRLHSAGLSRQYLCLDGFEHRHQDLRLHSHHQPARWRQALLACARHRHQRSLRPVTGAVHQFTCHPRHTAPDPARCQRSGHRLHPHSQVVHRHPAAQCRLRALSGSGR